MPGIGPSAAMRVIERLEGWTGRLVLRGADRPRGCDHHWGQFARLIKRLAETALEGQSSGVSEMVFAVDEARQSRAPRGGPCAALRCRQYL